MPVSPHSAPAEGSLQEEGDDEVSISSASQMCSPGWEHLARTHMCMCRGGSCTPLLSQPGFLLPTQKSLSCRSRVVTPTSAPLCMCPSISLPQFTPLPHHPPTAQGWCLEGRVLPIQLSIQPSFHPDLLKSLLCALHYTGLQYPFAILYFRHS